MIPLAAIGLRTDNGTCNQPITASHILSNTHTPILDIFSHIRNTTPIYTTPTYPTGSVFVTLSCRLSLHALQAGSSIQPNKPIRRHGE